jgi:hypothetical protein
MKRSILLTVFFLLGCVAKNYAQDDDLLKELETEDAAKVKQEITTATFKSTRIINQSSVEITGTGNLEFMITHHFGKAWVKDMSTGQNLANFFGVNSGLANTYLSFDYSPIRWMNLGVALAGKGHYEGMTKFKLLRQQTGLKNIPVSVAWVSNVNWDANNSTAAEYKSSTWNRFSFLHQLLVARKFSEDFSLQLSPSLIHYNVVGYGPKSSNNIYSIGVGGRYKLAAKKAITFEYSRQMNMYKDVLTSSGTFFDYVPDVISIGYDMDTGGHIFQFFITNSSFASNIQQLTVNPKADKGIYLGFNLNRSYAIKKVVHTGM